MALVSGILFNSETGKRLATYVLIGKRYALRGQRIVSRKTGKPVKEDDYLMPDDITDELPLSLPKCFAGGLPYSDCVWNYDPITGRKLAADAPVSERDTECEGTCADYQPLTAKEVGMKIEQYLSDPKIRGKALTRDDAPKDGLYRKGEFLGVINFSSHATFYDFSEEFPKGFGYAVYAEGGAAPSVSTDVVNIALEGRRPPKQIDPKKLLKIWKAGTE